MPVNKVYKSSYVIVINIYSCSGQVTLLLKKQVNKRVHSGRRHIIEFDLIIVLI